MLKFVIKDSPCYIGLNKDEPKLLAKVNEIIAKAKKSGELDEDFGEVAEGAAPGVVDVSAIRAGDRRCATRCNSAISCPIGTCCCRD